MDKDIISSHIFVFPFRWDVIKDKDCLNTCIDSRLDVERFIEYLRDEWEYDSNTSSIKNNEEVKNYADYNTCAYFYDNVKEAIYGKKDCIQIDNKSITIRNKKNTRFYLGKVFNKKISNKIVRCLNYKNVNGIYEIEIQKKNKDEKIINYKYNLKINSIKLKVYDTGVAALSYFLENSEYKDKEDILRINDYGRRIYPQYLPLENVRNSFLAKKLSLKFQNESIEEDFIFDSKRCPSKISRTIMNILGERFKYTGKELKEDCFSKEENILINPIIDDRMFVICYYNSNFYSRALTNYSTDEYLENDFWYQYLFIDNGGATCQDEKMKKELLEKSTYARWKNYGTLFGISRYSFVLICDESSFSKNILFHHINTIYYEMIVLALIQRASILRFSDETSRIAVLENKDKHIYRKIKKLQEHYIRFVNTIYFREVTAQEQGIELYDKLIEFMRIEKEVKELDEEIDEIQRYITLESSEKTNELLNIVTFVGIGISVMSLIATVFSNREKIESRKWLFMWQLIPFTGTFILIKALKKYINNWLK
ncbi:hypothetical protein [Clostridium tetani]|uniref:hypothetical protein n=1 Tax=Clostridium tetani TaxID=1513 RepID=UPI0024A8167B|nr:hypothetical protein [Clostridium tetani]